MLETPRLRIFCSLSRTDREPSRPCVPRCHEGREALNKTLVLAGNYHSCLRGQFRALDMAKVQKRLSNHEYCDHLPGTKQERCVHAHLASASNTRRETSRCFYLNTASRNNATQSTQHRIGLSSAVEAFFDCGEQLAQGGEEAVVRYHSAGQLPDPLDEGQLPTVRR